jgi:hypothetical protein
MLPALRKPPSSIIVAIVLASGCVESALDVESDERPNTPEPRLRPPAEYVLAPNGITRLTLEEAGILEPDGRAWAKVLGKALFWDQQAGSDGNACASCHFAAGTDLRIRNQLSPGLKDVASGPTGDSTFGSIHSDTGEFALGSMPSGATAAPNYELTRADFPSHKLLDKRDRNSPIRTTTNDAVSSQGSFNQRFSHVRFFGAPDACELLGGPFHVGSRAARQVEPRNTPTTINSAFFHSNFWDGRANNTSTVSARSACAISTAIPASGCSSSSRVCRDSIMSRSRTPAWHRRRSLRR